MKTAGLVSIALALGTTSSWAEITLQRAWTVSPPFAKSAEARRALSGAACVPGTSRCLVVNDEKKYAQFFSLSGTTLNPGRVIRLLPDVIDGAVMEEIDAEAVAYAPSREGQSPYLYLTGSHGRSRKGALRVSQFFLFRFPVDASLGDPTFAFDDDAPAPEIERTSLLRTVLKDHPDLASFAEQPLDQDGVTIEGLAIRGDDLLLGLRSPAPAGKAFVVRLATKDLFGQTVPPASVLRVQLDPGAGIRDMVAVDTGILILAGQSTEPTTESIAPGEPATLAKATGVSALWFWDGRSETARRLGPLPGVRASAKAETLLLLEETASAYRLLVMFDEAENGMPTEFLVSK